MQMATPRVGQYISYMTESYGPPRNYMPLQEIILDLFNFIKSKSFKDHQYNPEW